MPRLTTFRARAEAASDGSEFLFYRELRAGHLLDIGRHMEGPDRVQREPVLLGLL